MADEGDSDQSTTVGQIKAKITHTVGWATGDRRVEAKGKLELDHADQSSDASSAGEGDRGSAGAAANAAEIEPTSDEAIADAEREVRQAHQELPRD